MGFEQDRPVLSSRLRARPQKQGRLTFSLNPFVEESKRVVVKKPIKIHILFSFGILKKVFPKYLYEFVAPISVTAP